MLPWMHVSHSINLLTILSLPSFLLPNSFLSVLDYPVHVPPCLPLQLFPFPASVYPVLQLHWNEPGELVHVCAQPPLLVLHSLISVQRVEKNDDSTSTFSWSLFSHVFLNPPCSPTQPPICLLINPLFPDFILYTNLIPKPSQKISQVKLAYTYMSHSIKYAHHCNSFHCYQAHSQVCSCR